MEVDIVITAGVTLLAGFLILTSIMNGDFKNMFFVWVPVLFGSVGALYSLRTGNFYPLFIILAACYGGALLLKWLTTR